MKKVGDYGSRFFRSKRFLTFNVSSRREPVTTSCVFWGHLAALSKLISWYVLWSWRHSQRKIRIQIIEDHQNLLVKCSQAAPYSHFGSPSLRHEWEYRHIPSYSGIPRLFLQIRPSQTKHEEKKSWKIRFSIKLHLTSKQVHFPSSFNLVTRCTYVLDCLWILSQIGPDFLHYSTFSLDPISFWVKNWPIPWVPVVDLCPMTWR